MKNAKVLGIDAPDVNCPKRPKQIVAPDGQTAAEVICKMTDDYSDYSIRVKRANKVTSEASLDEGAHELVWSPDSKAFFVNGARGGYWGFFVAVYRLDQAGNLKKTDVTQNAQRDMVVSFPPCKAWNRDGNEECERIARDPEYNMSGVRWTVDSSAVDVYAEVPCSGSYGGIMCQVKGYELRASDGSILHSYSAKLIPASWRNAMAWKMHVPEPPRYGRANATFPPSH